MKKQVKIQLICALNLVMCSISLDFRYKGVLLKDHVLNGWHHELYD